MTSWWSAARKALACGMLALLFWQPGSAPGPVPSAVRYYDDRGGAPLVEEDVRVFGPWWGYTIATKILHPQGGGPFGAIVLNHGVPVAAGARSRESSEFFFHAASVLARRGYAVVMPLRRGFGATGGEFAEDAGSCANPDYDAGEAAAADDIMAAYEYARRLPYVDGSRMILAGQSAGAVAALYTAAMRDPEGLVAVLAFAPGMGGDPLRHPGEACAAAALARLFRELGAQVKAPVLFQYAANDLFFNAKTSRLWFDAFRRGGAKAEYVLQPPFGANGHYLFTDKAGAVIWLPAVGRFLDRHGVPFSAKRAA